MEKRIELLDLWRSLAILLMLVYHTLYDLTLVGALAEGWMAAPWARVMFWAGAASFVLISGASVRFSRDPKRRGFFVFCAGLLVSVVMALLDLPVAFGILQLLGVCMIAYGLLKPQLDRWNGPLFAAVCLVLFAAARVLTENVTVAARWLYPLGLRYEGFYSADYFPLLPWLFLFLAGTYLGRLLEENRTKPAFQKTFPAALTFPGRRSLWIYLLHQPVIYGLCCLCFQ